MLIALFHARSKNIRIYHVQTSGFSEYQGFTVISLVFFRKYSSQNKYIPRTDCPLADYWIQSSKFSLIHLVIVSLIAAVVATVLLSSTAASFAEITKRFHLKNSIVP